MDTLAEFLRKQKFIFLRDVAAHNHSRWSVVTGNEAGDLDSQVSAIAYAYLTTTLLHTPTVALSRTPRTDFRLRPENILALSYASITPDDLVCIDDLPHPLPGFSRIALVDHNRLGPEFAATEARGRVTGVIDHHEDEKLYLGVSPRLILPPERAASCSSLVTSNFRLTWDQNPADVPKELAFLLLCTVLIDTGGLKPSGKAQPIDFRAMEYLLPKAGLLPSTEVNTAALEAGTLPDRVEELSQELLVTKFDVHDLSTHDLLRRDYKQYEYSTAEDEGGYAVHVGLATVPVSLNVLSQKPPGIWAAGEEYMRERELDVLGMLLTYRTEKKGKHRRKLVFLVRPGGDSVLLDMLASALEEEEELELKRELEWEGDLRAPPGRARIWDQGNVKATRKQVAPVVGRACKMYLGLE
ncbi:DHH phosphoesterase [Dacryopinax primogenitus]|uniref:DHH phosphoesterase n=1 Tax=Dacryopinax primogenitus (strain DJM 731) TaxID=1858805 RepID=M5FZJ2_DACPD|nr:DHH phosphoesterase [Dacryopinax primogenitus]EJU01300.1 DHH phosphoesterase [Dacryopinax primogenitus]